MSKEKKEIVKEQDDAVEKLEAAKERILNDMITQLKSSVRNALNVEEVSEEEVIELTEEEQKLKDIEDEKVTLFDELKQSIEMKRKLTDDYDTQVQIGLIKRGLQPNAPKYTDLLSIKKLEVKDCEIKKQLGFVPVSPDYEYQGCLDYINNLKALNNLKYESLTHDLKEIEDKVEETKLEITKQLGMIDNRIPLVTERLKELGMTQAEIDLQVKGDKKDINYIG